MFINQKEAVLMSEFDKYQRTDSIDENKPGDRVVARRVELMVKLIKGRVIPVVGIRLMTTAMFNTT